MFHSPLCSVSSNSMAGAVRLDSYSFSHRPGPLQPHRNCLHTLRSDPRRHVPPPLGIVLRLRRKALLQHRQALLVPAR